MGIDLDPTSVGRPSTSVDGPGDPPGGEKLFPGRGELGEQLDDPEWIMDPSEGSLQGGTGRTGSVVSQW